MELLPDSNIWNGVFDSYHINLSQDLDKSEPMKEILMKTWLKIRDELQSTNN